MEYQFHSVIVEYQCLKESNQLSQENENQGDVDAGQVRAKEELKNYSLGEHGVRILFELHKAGKRDRQYDSCDIDFH
ncbi:hypothetical protein V6N12_066793 [Hibiscus sabdariffa]|uniref:Uncharacterized protein n=1 Tax=Hibiscus sabdariffa TaxID=183260 RepID=A0ABR2C985_9ROSI